MLIKVLMFVKIIVSSIRFIHIHNNVTIDMISINSKYLFTVASFLTISIFLATGYKIKQKADSNIGQQPKHGLELSLVFIGI